MLLPSEKLLVHFCSSSNVKNLAPFNVGISPAAWESQDTAFLEGVISMTCFELLIIDPHKL